MDLAVGIHSRSTRVSTHTDIDVFVSGSAACRVFPCSDDLSVRYQPQAIAREDILYSTICRWSPVVGFVACADEGAYGSTPESIVYSDHCVLAACLRENHFCSLCSNVKMKKRAF